MIVVKVELHSARTHEVTRLATVHISNDGTAQNTSYGNYFARAFGKRNQPLKTLPNRITDFPRKRKHALSLLKLALAAMGYCVLLGTSPVQAQHLDLGVDAGKAYSIVDGAFVPSTIPSVTALFGPVEVSTSMYLTGTRFYEQDSKLTWYQRESVQRRWTLYASVLHYAWPGGQNLLGQAGLRWRVR